MNIARAKIILEVLEQTPANRIHLDVWWDEDEDCGCIAGHISQYLLAEGLVDKLEADFGSEEVASDWLELTQEEANHLFRYSCSMKTDKYEALERLTQAIGVETDNSHVEI